jgi:hypothetical protein
MREFANLVNERSPRNESAIALTQRVHFFTHFVRSVVNSR